LPILDAYLHRTNALVIALSVTGEHERVGKKRPENASRERREIKKRQKSRQGAQGKSSWSRLENGGDQRRKGRFG
jgi:sRNA-binding carbon storage regulator CsrA